MKKKARDRVGVTLSRALFRKMWDPSTEAADPIFNWRLFCLFHSGVAHFSDMQKFAVPFVGAAFCGAPVRPNMLSMPKSAASA